MLIYVSCDWENKWKAEQITNELQVDDKENCYICPVLTFSHLSANDMEEEEKAEICLDLLTMCDMLIIGSSSVFYDKETEFAKKVGMEVHYL